MTKQEKETWRQGAEKCAAIEDEVKARLIELYGEERAADEFKWIKKECCNVFHLIVNGRADTTRKAGDLWPPQRPNTYEAIVRQNCINIL